MWYSLLKDKQKNKTCLLQWNVAIECFIDENQNFKYQSSLVNTLDNAFSAEQLIENICSCWSYMDLEA